MGVGSCKFDPNKFYFLNLDKGHASLLMLAIPNASFLLILPMDPNMWTMFIAHQLLQHFPNSIVPPCVRCPVGNTLPQDKQGFRCCAICGWKVHLKELPKLTVPANMCPCHHAMMEGVGRPLQRSTRYGNSALALYVRRTTKSTPSTPIQRCPWCTLKRY